MSRTTHDRVGKKTGKPPDDDSDLISWVQQFSCDEWGKRERGINLYYVDVDIRNWPVYDFLVVTWKGGIAYKIGAGIVWAEVFHYAKPKRKKIMLG